MKELVESILQKEYTKANELFSEQINSVVSRKLTEAKKMYAAKMSVGEQLNVDKRGNYDETGGRDVILSHEKKKRGLTENVSEEKIHNEKGEHLGDVMEITGSHAKDPTKKIKKFRAERKDGKTLITANKKAAHEFLENK